MRLALSSIEFDISRNPDGTLFFWHKSGLFGQLALDSFPKPFDGERRVELNRKLKEFTLHMGRYDLYWAVPAWLGRFIKDKA